MAFYQGYGDSNGLNKYIDTGSGLTGLGAAKAKRQKQALELKKLEQETYQSRFSEGANFQNEVEEAAYKMFDIPEGENPTIQQRQAAAATVPNALEFVTDYLRNVPASTTKDKEYQAIVKSTKDLMKKHANGELPEEITPAVIGMKAFYAMNRYDARKSGYASAQRVSETTTLMAQGQNRRQAEVAATEQAAAEQAAPAEAPVEEVIEETPAPVEEKKPSRSYAGRNKTRGDWKERNAAKKAAKQEAAAEWDAQNPGVPPGERERVKYYQDRHEFISKAEDEAEEAIRNPGVVEEAPVEEPAAAAAPAPALIEEVPPPKTPAQGTAQVGKAVKENAPISTAQAQAVTKDYASGKKPKQFWDRPAGRAILQRSLQTQGVIKGKDLSPDELARNIGYVATGEMYDGDFLKTQASALSAANKQTENERKARDAQREFEKEAVETNLDSIVANPVFDDVLGEGAADSLVGQAKMNMASEYDYLRKAVVNSGLVNKATPGDSGSFDAMRTTVARYMSSLALAYTAWNQESREKGGSGADRSMKTFLANASEGEHEIFWGWFGSDNELATQVRQSMGLSTGEIEALDVSLNGTAKGKY